MHARATPRTDDEGPRHVAIIGGGPIGLETALAVLDAGYTARIYERGRVAESLENWGHVTLFTPFGLNASKRGRAALQAGGIPLPADDDLLTGREFRRRYVLPLSRLQQLTDRVFENCEVVSVGRPHLWKGDQIGAADRADDGFQLLIRQPGNPSVPEFVATADTVIDCSGTYPNHNWIGAGGIPAIGERAIMNTEDYRLPDVFGQDHDRFANRSTLIAGSGFSAATAIVSLQRLSQKFPRTRVQWLTRGLRRSPLPIIDDDVLPQRRKLADQANALAVSDSPFCRWLRDGRIHQLERNKHGQIEVRLSLPDAIDSTQTVDQVIGLTGYRPDRALYEELQVHECYASQGPMKLSATRMSSDSSDCMAQPQTGVESLLNPEPQLFILGAKSYGRDSRFLIRTGLEQIRAVLGLLKQTEDHR